jgi:signal recognition particle subunit SRP54
MGKALKDIDISDDAFKHVEAIIQSMTPAERANPNLLNGSRRERLAKGSGTSVTQVNQLMKQFSDMRDMMKKMNQMGGMGKMPKMPGLRR